MELKIVICDDESGYRKLLHEKILQDSFVHDYEADIVECESGRQLIGELEEGLSVDVFFLDIQMEDGADDGIRLAKELRKRGETGLIVYVTSFIDYVQIGYEVKAFRYLLKSQIGENLPKVLEDIRHELSGEEFFCFQIGGESIRVDKSKVIYFESNKRQLKLFEESSAKTKEYCFYGSMDSVQSELDEKFLRCHRSYMVNTVYIKGWSSEQIELKCGITIPISRSYAKEVKQRLMLELV